MANDRTTRSAVPRVIESISRLPVLPHEDSLDWYSEGTGDLLSAKIP